MKNKFSYDNEYVIEWRKEISKNSNPLNVLNRTFEVINKKEHRITEKQMFQAYAAAEVVAITMLRIQFDWEDISRKNLNDFIGLDWEKMKLTLPAYTVLSARKAISILLALNSKKREVSDSNESNDSLMQGSSNNDDDWFLSLSLLEQRLNFN